MRNGLVRSHGSGLVMVLITLGVFAILSASIYGVLSANTRMIKQQQNMVKTYYLALSGIDVCVAALIKEDSLTSGDGIYTDTLGYEKFNAGTYADATSAPELVSYPSLDNGTVEVTVKAMDISGARWVHVESTATLAGAGTQRSTTVRYLLSQPSIVVRTN